MELSILIPVYNWDISALLTELLREMERFTLGARVELIVVDDRSSDTDLLARNADFITGNAQPYLKYRTVERNLGRSAIRNVLAAEASGRFLLFLDCDVVPDAPDFVRTYLTRAENGDFDVVCGGISYRSRVMNGPEFDYHAYLGNRKEVKDAAQRNQEPWRHILTSNIMVRKGVFQATPFDERFTGYGYEDIEWGVRLAQSYRVLHIDNTASHLGLVTKAAAYRKMRDSVPNYLLLKELCPAAFHASDLSLVVRLFRHGHPWLLKRMDRALGSLFLAGWMKNRFAFVMFQLDFAVLLALALEEHRCAAGGN
jgi:glycosyltransferase involved in cell wall biosynthesis